jgi:hypothetical protein
MYCILLEKEEYYGENEKCITFHSRLKKKTEERIGKTSRKTAYMRTAALENNTLRLVHTCEGVSDKHRWGNVSHVLQISRLQTQMNCV